MRSPVSLADLFLKILGRKTNGQSLGDYGYKNETVLPTHEKLSLEMCKVVIHLKFIEDARKK